MTILKKSKLGPQISCLKQAEPIPSDSDSWPGGALPYWVILGMCGQNG